MKKRVIVFSLIFWIIQGPSLVFANDGSLQIDTTLDKNNQKTELQYFEQEGDLVKLFRPETEKLVETVLKADEETYRETKTNLFVTELEKESILDSYQSLLFTPQTIVVNKSDYGVSLNQVETPLSWPVIVLSILGGAVMIYSIFRKKFESLKQE
ncbi:TPA: type VII secretion protein EssA [Streptococcus suis]|nr:type VII secretion protein EssA [Streptococcus suis]HEM5198086.1 type VII secretion protein EssA [Streptococcus suis]HEM5311887.1 type VII secretion protein EssA [Streptococcus suis]HEM5975545.1 type VII secretion protein EssA [Streptococcus suis]